MASSASKYTQSAQKEQPDSDYYKHQYQNAVKTIELIEGEREAQQQDRLRRSFTELAALRKQSQPLFERRNRRLSELLGAYDV